MSPHRHSPIPTNATEQEPVYPPAPSGPVPTLPVDRAIKARQREINRARSRQRGKP